MFKKEVQCLRNRFQVSNTLKGGMIVISEKRYNNFSELILNTKQIKKRSYNPIKINKHKQSSANLGKNTLTRLTKLVRTYLVSNLA